MMPLNRPSITPWELVPSILTWNSLPTEVELVPLWPIIYCECFWCYIHHRLWHLIMSYLLHNKYLVIKWMNGRSVLKRDCVQCHISEIKILEFSYVGQKMLLQGEYNPVLVCQGFLEQKPDILKTVSRKLSQFLGSGFLSPASSSGRFFLNSSKASIPSKWFCLCYSHLPPLGGGWALIDYPGRDGNGFESRVWYEGKIKK